MGVNIKPSWSVITVTHLEVSNRTHFFLQRGREGGRSEARGGNEGGRGGRRSGGRKVGSGKIFQE